MADGQGSSLASTSGGTRAAMRYGFWMPGFGGWLRHVEDEKMAATWDYCCNLTQRAEALGYSLTLLA